MHFRTFIAIDVSEEVRSRADRIIQGLRKSGAKVSWTAPENLHLTLKFLGDTPDTKIPEVCQRVAHAAAAGSPFQITFSQLGAFPRAAVPRTVWLGVAAGRDVVTELQTEIEAGLASAGFPAERRRYVPHLTLGRVRGGGATQRDLGERITAGAEATAGTVQVTEVLTMASFRDSQGPTYQVLGRATLGK